MEDRITIEFHGFTPSDAYDNDNIDQVVDVTRFVQSVSWMNAIKAPWESITVNMRIPLRHWNDVIPGPRMTDGKRTWRQPRPGFWVVVKEGQQAVAWGRASRIASGAAVGGGAQAHIQTMPIQVQCTSWLDVVQKSRIFLSPGMKSGIDGFIYKFDTWGPHMVKLLESFSTKYPGELFDHLWAHLVRVWLPSTFGTDRDGLPFLMGDQIPLVFDDISTSIYAPARAGQHLDVVGFAMNSAGSAIPHGTLWDLFTSSFGADPNIVELFPSLEEMPSTAINTKGIFKSLGVQPVLIYRLKPFLLEPISRSTSQRVNPAAQITNAEALGLFQKPIKRESGINPGTYVFSAADILRWSVAWSDDDRINATYVQTAVQPKTAIGMHGIFGTPQLWDDDIQQHGLRMYDADWPFFPTSTSESKHANLIRQLEALNEFAWIVVSSGQEFASGEVTTHYRPRLRAGNWAVLHFPPPEGDRHEGTVGDLDRWPFQTFHVYIESVSHSVDVDPVSGVVRRRTHFSYVRGSADVVGEPLRPVVGRDFDDTGLADLALPPGRALA